MTIHGDNRITGSITPPDDRKAEFTGRYNPDSGRITASFEIVDHMEGVFVTIEGQFKGRLSSDTTAEGTLSLTSTASDNTGATVEDKVTATWKIKRQGGKAAAPAPKKTIDPARYKIVSVPGDITWTRARNRAEKMGGHLAVITSKKELDLVFKLAKANPDVWHSAWGHQFGPWLGGYQKTGSREPNGGWTWVTGEPWKYEAWSPGEPNNLGGGPQDKLHLIDYSGAGAGWNDTNDAERGDVPILGFVVEFE